MKAKIMLIALALFISMTLAEVPNIDKVLGARVHEFATVDQKITHEAWFKLYMNATSMQFHVDREFDYEHSEIVVYTNETFFKYYVKHEASGETALNCTSHKPEKPMTDMDKPFEFVHDMPADHTVDVGPLLFDTFHAEEYKADFRSDKPHEIQWFVDQFGFGPK